MRLSLYTPFVLFLLGTLISAAPVRSSRLCFASYTAFSQRFVLQAVERASDVELVSPIVVRGGPSTTWLTRHLSSGEAVVEAAVQQIGSEQWMPRASPFSERCLVT